MSQLIESEEGGEIRLVWERQAIRERKISDIYKKRRIWLQRVKQDLHRPSNKETEDERNIRVQQIKDTKNGRPINETEGETNE